MAKLCDNKSVGLIYIFWNHLIAIERRNYPEAYALPAGHLDGDDFLAGLLRETREEIGLELKPEQLARPFEGRIDNPCKREGGAYHDWRVYQLVGPSLSTKDINAGSDAKKVIIVNQFQRQQWAQRTEYFMKKYNCHWTDVNKLTRKIFGDPEKKKTDPEWLAEMGLEPVWYFILRQLSYFDWPIPKKKS